MVKVNLGALRNLDAKPQLSTDELSQAIKYIPIPQEQLRIVTPDEPQQQQQLQQQEYFKPLGIRPSQINYPQLLTNGEDLSGVIVQAQDYVNNGLTKLRQKFKSQSSKIEELQNNYDDYFKGLKAAPVNNTENNKNSTQNGGFIQNVWNGIRGVADNFVRGNQNNTTNDPQRQSFVSSITNFFNPNKNNTGSTVLGENPSGGVISSGTTGGPLQFVQGVFNNLLNNKPPANNEGDEGNNNNNQGGNPIQNFVSNLNPFNRNNTNQTLVGQVVQGISNFIPQQQQQQQGDPQQGNLLQNVVNQVGQVWNNINPLGQKEKPTTAKPTTTTEVTLDATTEKNHLNKQEITSESDPNKPKKQNEVDKVDEENKEQEGEEEEEQQEEGEEDIKPVSESQQHDKRTE